MKGKMRFLFWFGCFLVLVLAILVRINIVVKNRTMEKTTNFSVRQEKGIPVSIEKILKGSYWVRERFSGKKIESQVYYAEVPLELKQKLKSGMKVSAGKCVGSIVNIDGAINLSSGLFPIRMQVNSSCRNDIEIFDIQLYQLKNVFSIPAVALQRDGENHFIWTIKDGKAEKKKIEVIQSTGRVFYSQKGLANGDQVVVYGVSDLYADAKVYITH